MAINFSDYNALRFLGYGCFIIAFSSQSATVPANVQLAEKQELVRGNGSELQSLDPHKIEGVPEANVSRDLLEGLTTSDENGKVVPGVATSWENTGFKTWIFHLRPEAKWSNGLPVTADDFVYSWRRLADPNTASVYVSFLQYAHIENIDDIIVGKKTPDKLGIQALDLHTLLINLDEPVSYLPKLLLHPPLSPVYQRAVEKYGDRWTNPRHWVGNGAYRLSEHRVNERIVLTKNPYYWDNTHTIIEKVTFLPIPSEVNDVHRYLASNESAMTFNNLPIEYFKKLKQAYPTELRVNPYLCTYLYELNNREPPFNDRRVRTALKLGLDRDVLVNKVLGQGQQPAYSFTHPDVDGAQIQVPGWYSLTQEERNRQGRALLAEAGFTAQQPLTLTLLYNTSDLHKKLAIAAAAIWKKNLGIHVTLENQEWKTYLDSRHQGNFTIARGAWCADYNEPSSFLNYFLSTSSTNTSFYHSTQFDGLMKEALIAADAATRAKDYQLAEQRLDEDSVIIPVFYFMNTRMVKPWVGGYSGKDPLDNIQDKNLYIIKH